MKQTHEMFRGYFWESTQKSVSKNNSLDSIIMKNSLEEVFYYFSNKPVQSKKNETLFLYFCLFSASMVLFSAAADMVWTSPVLPKLASNDTSINPLGRPITYYETSILAGLPALTSILGGVVFMKLPDLIGRRKSIIYLALGMLLSIIPLALLGNFHLYCVARASFSLFSGGVLVALPVYVSEICEEHDRLKFGCLLGATIPAGNLYAYILGPATSVPVFTLLCVAPLVPSLLCFLSVIPETPVHLDRLGKGVEEDYLDMAKSRSSYACLFGTQALREALVIATGANLAQQASGVAVLMAYLEPILTEAGAGLSGTSACVVVGSVQVFIFTITSFSVHKLGRRALLLFSCAASGVSLFVLGLCFYWKIHHPDLMAQLQWLPLASILTFVVVFSVGLGPIPVALMGDLFPSEVISVAMSFLSTLVGIVVFVLLLLFPIVAECLGVHFCVWAFSANCFVFSCFIYYMLPETETYLGTTIDGAGCK